MKTCLIVLPNPVLESPRMQVPLGVLYLGAVLEKEGYDIFITDMRAEYKLNPNLIPRGYDIYGVTATTAEYNYAKQLGEWLRIKEPKAKLIIGGPHATHLPMETLKETEYDIAVIGEGEETILDLASQKDLSSIPGIAYKHHTLIDVTKPRPLIKNLDIIPFPARHLLPYDHTFTRDLYPGARYGYGEPATALITERGCPFRCAYCANWDRGLRLRSIENVVKEVEECIEVFHCRHFKIIDDEFGVPKSRALKLCEALEPLNIKFRAATRVDMVDLELLKAFKKAGCEEIAFGVETPDETILKAMNKRQTLEQCKNAVKWAKEAGLRVKTYFMVCLPKETWESVEKLKAFVREAKPDKWTLSTFIPYPGCDIWANPEKYGVKILEKDFSKYWLYQDNSMIETDVASRDELNQHRIHLFKWLLNYDRERGLID